MQISTACMKFISSQRQILAMQTEDLRLQIRQIVIVHHDVIGRSQSLAAAHLRRHDRLDLGRSQAAARHHPRHLQVLRAIDDDDALTAFAIRAAFDQQRHGEDDIGRFGDSATCVRERANLRMQDAFETRFGLSVGKHPSPHCGTIERPVRIDDLMAKRLDQRRHGAALLAGQFMGNGVGIHKRRTEFDKQVSNGALATANAAGQANDKIAHGQACAAVFGRMPATAERTAPRVPPGPLAVRVTVASLPGRGISFAERTPLALSSARRS